MNYHLPSIDRNGMIEVDRLMLEKYHISILQMMEHAGENLARLVQAKLKKTIRKTVHILCGNGNNGGGGLVCARYLHNWGYNLQVFMVGDRAHRKVIPAQHLKTLDQMSIKVREDDPSQILQSAEIVVDAMIGYGLRGALSSSLIQIVRALNANISVNIIALDAPTGLDVTGLDNGEPLNAGATLTLALPKIGLLVPENRQCVGQIYLADIGVPQKVFEDMGINFDNCFVESAILKLKKDKTFEPFLL